MNASKLARWAALPAAAIVATSAGVAFAEDEAPTTPAAPAAQSEDPQTDATADDTAEDTGEDAVGPERSPDELAADIRAFLETEEGRALLTEIVAATDLDDAQLQELKAAIAELQVAVREAAADRTATSMQLDELRERIREIAMAIGHEAPHDAAADAEEVPADEDATDEDATDEGHRRGWQEKQAGESRGWNADEQVTSETADAEHGEKRGWQEKQDGESRGQDAAAERQGRPDGAERDDA